MKNAKISKNTFSLPHFLIHSITIICITIHRYVYKMKMSEVKKIIFKFAYANLRGIFYDDKIVKSTEKFF